jgi:hypothetical protein
MSAIVTDVERQRGSGAIISELMNTYKRPRTVAPLHLWVTGASIRGAKHRAEQEKNRTIHRIERKNEDEMKDKKTAIITFFSFCLHFLQSH